MDITLHSVPVKSYHITQDSSDKNYCITEYSVTNRILCMLLQAVQNKIGGSIVLPNVKSDKKLNEWLVDDDTGTPLYRQFDIRVPSQGTAILLNTIYLPPWTDENDKEITPAKYIHKGMHRTMDFCSLEPGCSLVCDITFYGIEITKREYCGGIANFIDFKSVDAEIVSDIYIENVGIGACIADNDGDLID